MHRSESSSKESQRIAEKSGVHGSGVSNPTTSQLYRPTSLPGPSWLEASPSTSTQEAPKKPRGINIHQKLRELYLHECRNGQFASDVAPPLRNLKRGSRLLEKLVERENLNTLIVNLYPGNKGYSLSLRLQGKVPPGSIGQAGRSPATEMVAETMFWLYSDEELLRCIDREEIPPSLADLLEADHSDLFYNGCVIAEVRDARLTFPLVDYETHYVLLRPTTQSILNDVNMLGAEHDLSAEERLALESQIVQATAPPLCLDPNPAVGIFLNNLQAKKQRFTTAPFRRLARKFSQVSVNRKRKLDQFTVHNNLHVYDFIAKKRAKANPGKQTRKFSEGVLPLPPPVPSDERVKLSAPSVDPDVFKYANVFEMPKQTSECTANIIEEYILETEREQGSKYLVKLTILQLVSNSEFLGELYVDRDYREGEKNGASCRFVLGTRAHANRYIQQFTEIFTEEGRKSVRITHVIPGQAGRVTVTPGMRERAVQLQAMQAALASAAAGKPSIVANTQQAATSIGQLQKATTQYTSLLKNATAPPNVNIHQLQQQQQQQAIPSVSGLTNSAIQSILSNALNPGVLANATMTNGPIQAQGQVGMVTNQSTNATVHYQPPPVQPTAQSSFSTKTEEINAIANSLMISAQQHEQKAPSQAHAAISPIATAVPAAASASAQNPTIIGLLNAGSPLTNPKLVARKANLNLQSPRLLDQNFNAVLNNNVSNPTLLVNNNQLRVTLSSFPNQIVNSSGQNAVAQHGGLTIVTTQGNIAIGNQAAQNQTYSLGNITSATGQTLTLTPNTGSAQGFTLSPAQNSQTYTVLQSNQNFSLPSFQINPAGGAGQSITIATSLPNQFTNPTPNSFTVNAPGQLFTVNIPSTANAATAKAVSNQNPSSKSFTIQSNNQAFAKAESSRSTNVRAQNAQRRLSNTFQQVTQNCELTKLLSERSDSRLLTERHIGDKSDNSRLCQVLTDSKTLVSENVLSQALTADATAASTIGLSMPGLRGLLAGTPSADNPMPGVSNSSPLLDRLTTPSAASFTSPPPAPSPSQNINFPNATFGTSPSHSFNSVNSSSPLPNLTSPKFASPSPKSQMQFQATSPSSKDGHNITSPMSSPPGSTSVNLNLQGLSIQELTGLSNIQVTGLAVPISLNVSGQAGAQGMLLTSLPVAATTTTTITTSTATMVLTNSSAGDGILSLPVAQLMGSGNKVNNVRAPASASIAIPQGTAQSIQLVSALQRTNRTANQMPGKAVQPIAARNVVNDQRPTIKMATGAAGATQLQISNSPAGQMVTLSPQQFLQLKHGFPSLVNQSCVNSPSALANKHRRRSNAADPNK